MFPTISGKYINLRLRWQNVSGLCNPSWQFNVKEPPKAKKTRKRREKTPPRKSKTKRSRTVAGPTVIILKEILREHNIKVSGNKNELLQRLKDHDIKF
jgi:hypothetical protein